MKVHLRVRARNPRPPHPPIVIAACRAYGITVETTDDPRAVTCDRCREFLAGKRKKRRMIRKRIR